MHNLEVALNLANVGLPVLPCNKDKKPIIHDWPNQASTDPEHLRNWFAKGKAAPAINLKGTGLVVVDVDNHEGRSNGVKAFEELLKIHSADTKEWIIVRTPNGGFHIYFLHPSVGECIGNTTGKIAPGIDTRGYGGYILAPDAILDEGKTYRALDGHPELVDAYKAGIIPEIPEWIMALIRKPKYEEPIRGSAPSHRYADEAFKRECEAVATAPQGQRNHTLNIGAFNLGQLIPSGALSRSQVEASLLQAALAAGLSKDEARATIASGLDEGKNRPRVVPERYKFLPNKRPAVFPTSAEQWPKPKPLTSDLLPVDAFDLKFLPENLALWVADVADRMQCPYDFVGVPAIVALGATLGRKIAIRPRQKTDWYEVSNLWAMIVGRPGLMKTPAMQEALKPLNRLEVNARKEHEAAIKKYEFNLEVFKLDKAKAQKDALSKGRDARKILAQLIEPEHPKDRRYVVNDTSYESLGEIMADNPNGLLAFRDELVSLLRTLDREDFAAARGFYLSAWNGTGDYTFDRILRGKRHIEAICLSLLGSTQPGRLAEYIRRATNGGAGDDGLIQRFGLLVWPDLPPEWKEVDRYPDTEARQKAWLTFEAFECLSAEHVFAERDDFGSLPYLRFDNAAQERFSEWHRELECRLRSEELSPSLESHLSKYRKLVPSLALINHLADGHKGSVCETALLRALAFAEYLESHAKRAYSAGTQSETLAAKAIVKRIRQSDLQDGFTLRDVHQHNWSNLTDREVVKSGLDLLIDLDWLVARTESTGGRSKVTYLINPKALV